MVQGINLKHTIRIMQTLVDQGLVDFRVVAPLILGLSKIYQKKFNYLLSESSTTLESLRSPFAEEEAHVRGY